MATNGEMTPREIQRATNKALRAMGKAVNEWSVRNTLCQLTDFGFWKGEAYINLDEDMARRVVSQALVTVKNEPDHVIRDIYDVVHHYDPNDDRE